MALRIETLSGGTTTLPEEQVEELRMMTFRGPLIGPGDDSYDEARVVQNAMHDRRPGLIIRCSGTADVIDAVNLAREHQLLTAVRGGGHSIGGLCTCDDGVMIDLSAMRGVWVDPDRRVVRVQGGCTWGDVDREAQAFGLAVPGGIVSTTGVAGLTLGGGIGWLHRKWGLACDNLLAAEIVTADGQLLRASGSQNEDLFWALRGGGGNFGVVTAFEFAAHELGPIVMAAAPIYGVDAADDVMRAWRAWTETLPDEVTTRSVFWSMPEDPSLPPAVHNQEVLILGALYAGSADEGETVLQPIREFATPLADLSEQMPYRMFQAAFDPFFPKGEIASYWKSTYLPALNDDAVDLVVKRARSRLSPLTLVHVPLMGGATSRLGATETAFGDRSAPYMLSVDGNWVEPDHAQAEIAWVRETIDEAQRFSSGTYLNFGGDEPDASAAVEAAFGENLPRLREIKQKYDPQNLFRLNNNITSG
jgi:FAD/FMN-containing dehydrogenase